MTGIETMRAMAKKIAVPFVEKIDDAMLDAVLVKIVPVDWARDRAVLPVRHGGTIRIATADPAAIQPLDDLGVLLRVEPLPLLAPREEILRAIEHCYFERDDGSRAAMSAMAEADGDETAAPRSDDLLRASANAPATQFINSILLDALKQRASDVHIEPFESKLRLRFRVDGFLYEQTAPPKQLEAAITSRIKVMAKLDIAEKRLPQDGMVKVRVGEREIDIRVSTVPVAEGERIVLRLLNREAMALPLTDLGMPEDILEQFKTLLQEPNGIILVTGPTGSGKTTTLYAALQQMDTEHRNILTIEDPIEYQLPDIGQIQVKPKIGLTFAQGLRHILRQDPDVVFVGEIRDQETAEIALRASLTGHLVFATLHTNDATSAIVRLGDMGLERYLISAAIRGVMAQRLVRKLCPHCRKPTGRARSPSAPHPDAERRGEPPRPTSEFIAVGCEKCLGGYRGRTGLYELLIADAEMQEAIRSNATAAALRELGLKRGMHTLSASGLDLVRRGETSMDELVRSVGTDILRPAM